MKHIILMGAGGKMGCRITDNLLHDTEYNVSHVEVSPMGIQRLHDRGVEIAKQEDVLSSGDIVILAIPDKLIGSITANIIPRMKKGAMVFGLDPAAAYANVMPIREDLTYFVAHPTHPPLFNTETSPEAQRDWFGGIAKQDAVCALYRGEDAQYEIGEKLARKIYKPIVNTYRITVEQMAILEPGLVETFSSTLIEAMKMAFDRVVSMGLPRDAALSFMMGHIRIQFAVLFGYADFNFSDGALLAMKQAREQLLQPDWMEKVFSLESIRESVEHITDAIKI